MTSGDERFETGSEAGDDDLDQQLAGAGDRSRRSLPRGRPWSVARLVTLRPAPALVFVPLGALLSPSVTGVLSVSTLGHLYPVMAVALAALGIVVGLRVHVVQREVRAWLALATVEACTTLVVVSTTAVWLLHQWDLSLGAPLWLPSLVLGIGASTTVARESGAPSEGLTHRVIDRLADLDDVVPIVLGGLVIAVATSGGPRSAPWLLLLNLAAPLAVAVAGWLLLELADDEAERAVFVLGLVALLGGTAAYLGVSPLLAGLVAGVFWRHAPGRADVIVRADVRRFRHPLVMLLLLSAGALAPVSRLAVVLGLVFVLTRMSGKLLGGLMVTRLMPGESATDLGSRLLSPGVVGLGFALSFHLVAGTSLSGAVLAAVTLGTLLSELVANLATASPADR